MRVLVGGIVAFVLMATSASAAAAVTADCGELQSALNTASAGEVITLDQLCTTGFPYKLPNVAVTLTGTAGAGFDGGGPQLEGEEAAATIEHLLFENANNPSVKGGALDLDAGGQPIDFTLSDDIFEHDAVTAAESAGGGAFIETEGEVTVAGSTFTDDSATGTEPAGGGLAVDVASANLSGDSFSGDSAGPNGFGGALYAVLTGTGSTLSSSQFSDDTATDIGGGALISSEAKAGLAMTLSGDTFSHNSVSDPSGTSSSFTGYSGGGLSFLGAEPVTLVQSDDTFDSNTVSFKPTAADAAGAGENVSSAELQSTGDRFTNNTLQSPDEAKNKAMEPVWGWGAGLSVVECGDAHTPPPGTPSILSTLSDAVVAGNTLMSGPSANGAGIYVGEILCATGYTILHLNDSTVAGNVVSGASGPVAGIDGGPSDVLTLANTIVDGDGGGSELGGFSSLAGVSAAYSDVCSGSSPLAGTGNICADPQLVGPGPGSADVHETGASPTLGAGSNALVPSGLSTDAFGGPRIAGPIGCGSSPAPIVDIGAAEYVYPVPPCPPLIGKGLSSLTAPILSSLSESAKTWREGKLPAQLSSSKNTGKHKPPVGTTFSFALNEPAQVTFTFMRSANGRKVGKKCVAKTSKNKHKHRCTRTVIAGTLTFSAHAGVNKVRFQGLISTHRKLTPDSYTMLVAATASGKRSSTRTLRFTITG
jgi:hypothetical protein